MSNWEAMALKLLWDNLNLNRKISFKKTNLLTIIIWLMKQLEVFMFNKNNPTIYLTCKESYCIENRKLSNSLKIYHKCFNIILTKISIKRTRAQKITADTIIQRNSSNKIFILIKIKINHITLKKERITAYQVSKTIFW